MPRRVLPLLALAALAATPAAAQSHDDGTTGVHGMLVFGDSAVYLSHLPLYRAPHDWQIVVRATVTSDATTSVPDALAALRADQAANGAEIYTLEPEPFPLSRLSGLEEGRTMRFRGKLYRGHFERGGTPIVTGAVFEVSPVYARGVANVPPPPGVTMEETWFLFGTPGDSYLLHHVEGAPDFDQVVRLERAGPAGGSELRLPLVVGLYGTERDRPLEEGEMVGAYGRGHDAGDAIVRYRVARRVYLELDDLARP